MNIHRSLLMKKTRKIQSKYNEFIIEVFLENIQYEYIENFGSFLGVAHDVYRRRYMP